MEIRSLVLNHYQAKPLADEVTRWSMRKMFRQVSGENSNAYHESEGSSANSEGFLRVPGELSTSIIHSSIGKINNTSETTLKFNQQGSNMSYISPTLSSSSEGVDDTSYAIAGVVGIIVVIAIIGGSICYVKSYGCDEYMSCCGEMIGKCCLAILIALICGKRTQSPVN